MSESMYYVSNEHRTNFKTMQSQFADSWSSEYAAGSYIAALPDIFKRINWDDQDSPIAWYFGDWIEEDGDGYHKESEVMAGLSSTYQLLVRAGVELFTSSRHDFDLMHLLGNADSKHYAVFLQLLEIRRRSSVLDLAGDVPEEEY